VRDQEAVRRGLVPCDHVGGSGQRQLDQVLPVGRLADDRQRERDAQGAVRDVVRPCRRRPDGPVHAVVGPVRGREVWRDGGDGQVEVSGVESAQRDAGIAHEELEHLVPALTVEAGANQPQCPVGRLVPARCPQRDGDPREAEYNEQSSNRST
jgi:hypothetical protein